MMDKVTFSSRRAVLSLFATVPIILGSRSAMAAKLVISVFKDPNCGCCTGWVEHLERSGFAVQVTETAGLRLVRARLGVPADLASCHTAQVDGYVIEGHVPASTIERLLAERPKAAGLAVPGMPVGSSGMEGDGPEPYDVILFAKESRETFARYLSDRPL